MFAKILKMMNYRIWGNKGYYVLIWNLGWRSSSRSALLEGRSGSIPAGVMGFFSDIFLPTVPWPWGRLSPYENEYQEHFLWVKAASA